MNPNARFRMAAGIAWAVVGILAASVWAAESVRAPEPARGGRVEIVLCLDTSNSMDGLIESAKQKLWAVVNELATARPRPVLRVALYQYGNNGVDSKAGWVQQVCPLTDDLDTVYGKLFGLKTNGGTEYVARVLDAATRELQWDEGKGTLRIIFVAGNEPATQDRKMDLRSACTAAASKGIIVNTIHCGPEEEGRRTGWADAATWADGRYAAIDQDRGTVTVQTPFDQKLTELGGELNKTYVGYGEGGKGGAGNQALQDSNAASVGAPAAAERAVAKASGMYSNAGWDLVDAVRDKKVDLARLESEKLPENMRSMNEEQRKDYVEQQAKRRAELQKEVQELSAKREAFVKEQMDKQGLSEAKALDTALRAAVREQAEKKNFQFEK